MQLLVDPVGVGALELSGSGVRELQGRQIQVEADEFQLREDSHEPARQPGGASVWAVATEQALELPATDPPPVPKGPVESHERRTQSVLLLVHLLTKA